MIWVTLDGPMHLASLQADSNRLYIYLFIFVY